MSLINTLTRGLIYKDKNSQYLISPRLTSLLHVYIPLFPVWILSLFTNWGKKVIGRALGFSCCSNCGMPWKYVKGQDILFSDHSGIFPLCVECFNELTPEEIDSHIEALVLSWIKINERYGLNWKNEQTPAEIVAAAKQQVRVMKTAK